MAAIVSATSDRRIAKIRMLSAALGPEGSLQQPTGESKRNARITMAA
jgi:hypothetical protein